MPDNTKASDKAKRLAHLVKHFDEDAVRSFNSAIRQYRSKVDIDELTIHFESIFQKLEDLRHDRQRQTTEADFETCAASFIT
jgi:hypothetical protein